MYCISLTIDFISISSKKLSDLTVEQKRLLIDHGDSLFAKGIKIMKMPVHKLTACAATCLMLFVFGANAADAQYHCQSVGTKGPSTTVTASSVDDANRKASNQFGGRQFTCTKK